ncbi:glutathione S-transferase-like protein [Trichosporon asahii var. asahii CBS 8904]|uniref:Glutathione S-transferase-like protein n=2 Tax=Trichosporon asahii var. asahii TaxID=189963 RepID=K1WWT1_TRIAC|nr:hypothetical protein A1Q1_03968 [Trichosporon asahii var. asahii CBS 2479]EJT52452.1 hypothetical protein A1Q1_03968 [Trichosporon asahii var. asahii CBS 2479]EKD05149.1 glutathione S-transferase-like protein [Trichosporon asahii var. asahii CBS 8904]
MITIWGRHNSNNVKKALWAAYELGLDFESKIVGGPYGGTHTPEYLAMNPMAQIPTLVDDDFVLCESNAIVRYMYAQYSAEYREMKPKDKAVGDRWMDWCSSSFAPVYRDVFWPIVREKEENRNWDSINKAKDKCEELLRIPEQWLETHDWFSGDEFGAGDIPLGCFLYGWFEMDIERKQKTPNLEKWYARLKARPTYQRGVMVPLT